MRRKRALVTICGAVVSLATAAMTLASSPAAWSTHQSEVVAKCVAASGLKDAKLIGSLVEYDDSVGYTVALIGGTYPQAHMKNQPGRSLCLFDKRKRTAHAAPADDIK